MAYFYREMISEELLYAYSDLLKSYNDGKNENDLQRKLALFIHYAKQNELESIKVKNKSRELFNSNNIKVKLIEILKYVGEFDKADCIYLYDWYDILNLLKECEIIDESVFKSIFSKIEKIFNE